MNPLAVATLCLSLTLICSTGAAQRADSCSAFLWNFHMPLEVAFIGFSCLPSYICDSSTFTACDLYPVSTPLVIQVMFILEISHHSLFSVSSVPVKPGCYGSAHQVPPAGAHIYVSQSYVLR